jgi:CsoR family transcriptional regulator, copper-sensing transcriptional repressor
MNAKPQTGDPQEAEQAHRRQIITRLARIEGQVRGIQGMISDNCSCEQVALQLTAARRALDKAFYEMMACSLNTHVEAAGDMNEVRASTKELARLLAKFG